MDLILLEKNLPTHYQSMLSYISQQFPVIAKATKNFNKTQSQFMDNMLTVSQPTELRSLRQILAEVNKSKAALDEVYFKLQKKKVRIKQKQRKLETEKDEFERELLTIDIAKLESQIANTMGYVEGAIRKISAYMSQYQNILDYLGKDEFTEEDFEKDEERYHIMKMFEQALCAARAHGGSIDEGNHIYCYQIGVGGTAAQLEVSAFLQIEEDMLKNNQISTHKNTWDWMHAMANKYAGCATKFAEAKHMTLISNKSLHK